MSKGFFIVIRKNIRKIAAERWAATYIEPMRGWLPAKGKDVEEIIQLQKDQYHARKTANQLVPHLVHRHEGPMACGKMTRFVEV
jgi:hypothetical protein